MNRRMLMVVLVIVFAMNVASAKAPPAMVALDPGVTSAPQAIGNKSPAPVAGCAPDAVPAGSVCLDKYEASVWRVPDPTTTNVTLVRKIQLGRATRADLEAGGATQLGVTVDYAPCAHNGQNCANDIYAVSLPS